MLSNIQVSVQSTFFSYLKCFPFYLIYNVYALHWFMSHVSEIPFDLLLLPDRTFDTHLNQRFPRTSFMEDNFSMDPGHRGEMVSGLFKCITFIVYFYFCNYYTSSTSDLQALDPRGWGPLI